MPRKCAFARANAPAAGSVSAAFTFDDTRATAADMRGHVPSLVASGTVLAAGTFVTLTEPLVAAATGAGLCSFGAVAAAAPHPRLDRGAGLPFVAGHPHSGPAAAGAGSEPPLVGELAYADDGVAELARGAFDPPPVHDVIHSGQVDGFHASAA